MQHGKDVVAVKRVRIGGRWGARIGNPQSGTVQICHSSYHFLTVRALGGRSAQLDLVDRNSLSPARCRLGPFTRHSLGSSQRPAHVTPAYPATVLITLLRIRSACLEEVMWGCRRRVCEHHKITLFKYQNAYKTPCRCSRCFSLLQVIFCQDRSRSSSLAASLARRLSGEEPNVYKNGRWYRIQG